MLRAGHLGEEVFGLELLEKVGDQLCGAAAEGDEDTSEAVRDPAARLHRRRPTASRKKRTATAWGCTCPFWRKNLSGGRTFLEEEDVGVRQFGDQLVGQVENQRRHYVLPNFLGYYTLQGHRLREDGWLEVRFARSE